MRRITVWLVVALLAQISSLSVAQAARWTTIESAGVHAAREETTFSPCGGNKLCLLGGRGQAPTPVLDTETLTWSNGPAPPIEMHHFQGVVGPDGCAWIFGAWTGPFPGEVAVPDIYKYCAESSKWEVVGKMSRPRGAGAAVYYKGNFYVASGNVGGHKVDADTVKWFDKYDPVTKVWTVMPDVPHPRDHVGAGILGNKLYLVGGRDSGGADYPHFFDLTEPNVDVYDFGAGSWSTLDDEFPAPRAGASVVKYKGALWIAGGEGSGKAWDQVDILKGSSFSSGPKMPNPRHGFGLVSCNGVLWVAGGAGTEGGGVSQTMLDAYYSGSKPKACTFSGTSTTQPSSSPSLSGSPPSNPSSATSGADGGESSSSEKACFPGHATVRLFDGSIKNMDALQTGDRVLVAHPDQYSEVFFFSHKHPHHVSNFVSLKTDSEFALHVSARHLVYANGELTEARNVRLGDILSVAHQTETATVTSVNRIVAKGLYNPHTLHGNIIVDNIAASTLTRSVHPRVAKAFLIPFNAVYRVLGPHEYVDTLNRHVLRALDYFVW